MCSYASGTVRGAPDTSNGSVLIDPSTRPDDLGRPGHVFPLRYREGGVLMRAGHTEAAVDLAKISGLYPAGVICEIMNDDGSMARMDDLEKYSKKWGIQIVTIAQLIEYTVIFGRMDLKARLIPMSILLL